MKKIHSIFIGLIIISIGCQSGKNDYPMANEMASFDAEYAPEMMDERLGDTKMEEAQTDQMLIKTAYLGIEIAQYEKSRQQIDSLMRIHAAWVSSENLNNSDYRISNDISIRVPASNFDRFIGNLLVIAKKVDYQRIESYDVTEEYIDIESRLKNQKSVEQKFIGLLRRTDSIDEILKIETKLAEIRGQIESFEGRIKYLKDRASYCTVNLNVYQKIDFKYLPEPMESFWERFKNSLNKGWKGFVGFLLLLVRLWPLWIIGVGIWFLVSWFLKRRNAKPMKDKKKKKEKGKTKSRKNGKQDFSETINI